MNIEIWGDIWTLNNKNVNHIFHVIKTKIKGHRIPYKVSNLRKILYKDTPNFVIESSVLKSRF